MSAQDRLDRQDALYQMSIRLPDLGASEVPCSQDPELFFPVGDMDTENTPAWRQAQRAKQQCGTCPVQGSCLQFALHNGENEGVWGGLTPGERRTVLVLRRRNAAGGDEGLGVAA